MNKLGKLGSDYIMDDDVESIVKSHNGNIREMGYTIMGLEIEVDYIKESKSLTVEEKLNAVSKYKLVISALMKVINGDDQ